MRFVLAFADTLRGLEEKPRWLPELLDFKWAHILDAAGSDGGTLYDNFLPWLEEAVQGKKGVEVHPSPLFQEIFTAMGQRPLAEARLIPLVDLKLKKAVHDPAAKRAASRCIVRHLSEWAEGDGVWPALTEALQPVCGDRERQHLAGQNERIAQLEFFSRCKGIEGFPSSGEVYHIHPIGLLGQVEALNSEPFEMYASLGNPPASDDWWYVEMLERTHRQLEEFSGLRQTTEDSKRVVDIYYTVLTTGRKRTNFNPEELTDELVDEAFTPVEQARDEAAAYLEQARSEQGLNRTLREQITQLLNAIQQNMLFDVLAIVLMANKAKYIRDEAEAIYEEVELSFTGHGGQFEQSASHVFGLGNVATDELANEANRVSFEYGDPEGVVAQWERRADNARNYSSEITRILNDLGSEPGVSPLLLQRVLHEVKGEYEKSKQILQEITVYRAASETQ